MTVAIRVGRRTGAAVVEPVREVVQLSVSSLAEALSPHLRHQLIWASSAPRRSIEVDVSGLEEDTAATLFALLAATTHRAREVGSEIRVTRVPPNLVRSLRAAGLKSAH